jgi:pimeloyl-ACP methyl ester carboxylesterase
MANTGTAMRPREGSTHPVARKVRRVLAIAGSVVLAGSLGLVGVLLYWSYPGKPQPFLDELGRPLPGSIAEKIRVPINGVEQAMVIKSRDATHPVLLYLHGGMPDYFLTQDYPTGLEDAFTVVWWDRRGAGLSYRADTPPITTEQLIADTLAVTDYLRDRFGQDKIYLMGHSEGTFLGIQAAARAPERYHAYIAVAQMANQRRSEALAYDYMLQQFKAAGDTAMVRKLEAAPATLEGGTPAGYLAVRDEAMHRLGVGTMRDMDSVASGLFLRSLQFREFTLGDKVNLWRGKRAAGVSVVWGEALATDLASAVPALAIPVYFLHGSYDYTCSYQLARDYLARLQAPVKGFYTFEYSAHSPNFEEPGRVLRILREDVLAGTTRLADEQ